MQNGIEDGVFPPALRVRAAVLNDPSRCDDVSLDHAVRGLGAGKPPVWIDLCGPDTPEVRESVRAHFGFHELAVEDAFSAEERPTLRMYDETLYISIVAPVGDDPLEADFEEVSCFIIENLIVTITNRPVPIVDRWFERWRNRPSRLKGGPFYILHAVLDAVVDAYFPIVDAIEDAIDEYAEDIYQDREKTLGDLHRLRRRLIEMRRLAVPSRDVIMGLLRRDHELLPHETEAYFQDVFDHILRILDSIDVNRDTLTSVMDIHLSSVSNRLSVVVKKMTVFSCCFMSASVVAGFYGMNFRHMPDLDWSYPVYPLLVMVACWTATYLYFKWKRWA